MAKRTTTTTTTTNNAPTTTATPPNANTANKADRIREYAKANPTLGPSQIAKALTAAGVEVNASRVSTVLRQGTSSGKVDVEQIKMAAEFVKGFAGSTDDAQKAIESVGSFVEKCGGAQKALGALEAYKALSSALA